MNLKTRTALQRIYDSLTPDEMQEAAQMHRDAMTDKRRDVKSKLYVGIRVKFDNREGVETHGTVISLKSKRVQILADDGLKWRVPATMLSLEDASK